METLPAHTNVLILGAGGAGMMCGIEAGNRGRSVVIIDHATKLGGKILISGGGRCNFTNVGASAHQYVSSNSHFCKSALSRYTPQDFISMVSKHGIPFHEKKLGQQFCDRSAQDIVSLLKTECENANVKLFLQSTIQSIQKLDSKQFSVLTSRGTIQCDSLVIATGGLSIPKIGATGFGYEVAKQFGHTIVPTAPALDGFTLRASDHTRFESLSGLSFDSIVTCMPDQRPSIQFRENTLFTHSGLSGPAMLQASLHWFANDSIWIDFLPRFHDQGSTLFDWLMDQKREGNTSLLKNLLSGFLPSRLAERLTLLLYPDSNEKPLPQLSEKLLKNVSDQIHHFELKPAGTVGYSKAEVTRGGVNTNEISSKTMESKLEPDLYFIGEVVDVTGWLGGYNFQWAWASGWAAGQSV